MKNTISAVGCFAVVYFKRDNVYEVVLVRRKDGGYLELPGGGLDVALDITPKTDPFENCVIREVKEESGIILSESCLFNRGVLVQRICVGSHSYCIGTVHLYSQLCDKLGDSEFIKTLENFSSEESSEVVIIAVDEGFFKNTEISLAARRMIAIALNSVEAVDNTQVKHSALSLHVSIGRLGDIVFETVV
jgi:8-oxo-dGTP pyrophosphatase MutT (NUDIX family)